jgi:membrane protease subunit (stomatin/prohibitin family)
LDARTKMGVIGDLNRYTQFQAAESMRDAAKNPGGTAGAGLGAGMGFAMGQQMAQAMAGTASGPAAPPPIPTAAAYFVAINNQQAGPFDLANLTQMARSGEISRDSLVWKNGMASWAAAGSVGELTSVFSTLPPPLPRG